MTRIVQYTENGDIDRLQIAEVETPHAGTGQVRVRVTYAGLNPVDWKILSGGFGAVQGVSGNGADFSGVVDQVGEGVDGFKPGDLVFGGHRSAAQADHIIVSNPTEALHHVPEGLGLEVAGGLFITGLTAVAGIRALNIAAGETVYVSGATGGVGIIAAQLALALGARVIGSASEANLGVLQSLGIVPVAYGDGLESRLRELAPEGIQAAYSTQGVDEVRSLIELDIPTDRINSIGAGPAAAELGVLTSGSAAAQAGDLDWLALAIASGRVFVPVARVFDPEEVHDAYRFLKEGHPVGKVLLRFGTALLTNEQRAYLTD